MTIRLRSRPVTPRRANLDDLIDADQVAEMLGLSTARSVTVYRSRYPDFPIPAVERNSGRCMLWLRPEVERWMKAHPRLGRKARDAEDGPS
jgi:predicted DNA-binding transcriptional regulator AlpA